MPFNPEEMNKCIQDIQGKNLGEISDTMKRLRANKDIHDFRFIQEANGTGIGLAMINKPPNSKDATVVSYFPPTNKAIADYETYRKEQKFVYGREIEPLPF